MSLDVRLPQLAYTCAPFKVQTDSLVMSDSGFAYSAAYSALPQRAVWLAANAEKCNFQAR